MGPRESNNTNFDNFDNFGSLVKAKLSEGRAGRVDCHGQPALNFGLRFSGGVAGSRSRNDDLTAHDSSDDRAPSQELFGFASESQPNLNRVLLILSALILDSRVDRGIPSLAAAPKGPEIRPLVSASVASMISHSSRGASPACLGA